MPSRSSPGFGGSIVLFALLGLATGVAWAVLAGDHAPAEIWAKLTGASTPEPPPVRPPVPTPDRPTPPTKITTPTEPAPATPPSSVYAAAEMNRLRERLDRALFRGDLPEAQKALAEIRNEKVPPEARAWYDETRPRVATYAALMMLTDDGAPVPPPALFEVALPGATRTVRILERSDAKISFEEFSGAKIGIAPSMLRGEPKPLEPESAHYAAVLELIDRGKERGVEIKTVVRPSGRGFSVASAAGGAPTPMDYFDLADFANHWGLTAAVPALFEWAARDNPGVEGAVREVKARRLMKVFLVCLSIRNLPEARRVLGILNARFAGTEAFRELADGPMAAFYAEATGSELKADAPALAQTSPPPRAPDPAPEEPAAGTRSNNLQEAQALIQKGDAAFEAAMGHVQRANPNTNPRGCDEENRKALLKLQEARGAFNEAQEIYDNAGQSVPKSLMEKLRRATQELYFCRRRAV
jgi:hypothetical protein